MNELVLTTPDKMSSLDVAELTGMNHKNVLRAIRNMEPAWEKVQGRKFELSSYTYDTANGGQKEVPCYILSKTEWLYIGTKFNDEARAKLILRWEQLEKEHAASHLAVPTSFREALLLAAEQQAQIEEQQKLLTEQNTHINELTNAVAEMAEKVSYVDRILQSKSTATVTQIAQDYGMSAKRFNKILEELRIQHKVGGQWVLYAVFLPEGYVHSRPTEIEKADGTTKVVYNTEWTTKGRLFLYEELKRKGILPLIEQ